MEEQRCGMEEKINDFSVYIKIKLKAKMRFFLND